MDTKKFLMGTVAGGISFFFVGYLVYGLALAGFMAEHTVPGVARPMEQMIWWSLIAGNFAAAALLTYIFLKWANIASFGGGLSAAATIGFLMAASFDFSMYATSNMMDLKAALTDMVAFSVMSGISGGVIGAVLGMGKKA